MLVLVRPFTVLDNQDIKYDLRYHCTMDQLQAAVESLACSGHLWIPRRVVYCVCVYDGGCAAVFGMTMDLWSSGGDLYSAGLIG